MKEIKYRVIFKDRTYYWGFIDGSFISPPFGDGYGISDVKEISSAFTSLKDKNGKEIFESDILYCGGWSGVPYLKPYAMPEKHAKGENFIVVKMDCGFVLRHISTFGETSEKFFYTPNAIIKGWPIINNYDFWNLQRSFEVIGNIYEHKHLLEGERND